MKYTSGINKYEKEYIRFDFDKLTLHANILWGNCGVLAIHHVSTNDAIKKITQREIAEMLYDIRNDALVVGNIGKKSVLLFTDVKDGIIVQLFNILLPKQTWTQESNMGVNYNSGREIVIRFIHYEQLEEILK